MSKESSDESSQATGGETPSGRKPGVDSLEAELLEAVRSASVEFTAQDWVDILNDGRRVLRGS